MSLTAEIYPDNAENKNVTWVSDNISVATVDATTSLTTTVTAVAPGTATITVTTEENNKSAEITVIVISGKFSVSGTKQVVFSPGNLQYNTGTNEWRFAPHQYDICHVDGDKVGEDYEDWKKDSKWTDLFGWGMWLSSNGENDDISPTKTLFSQSNYLSSVTSGEFSGTSAIGSEWENLTKAELGYLFNYRSYANGTRANKYGVGTIHSILGVIPPRYGCLRPQRPRSLWSLLGVLRLRQVLHLWSAFRRQLRQPEFRRQPLHWVRGSSRARGK